MSGNTTMLGLLLDAGDSAQVIATATVIGMFVVGAAAGKTIANWFRHHYASVVLIVASGLICLDAAIPVCGIIPFVLAMGILNASLNHVAGVAVSLTYVTGTLVKFGQGLGDWLSGGKVDRAWMLQLPLWMSLLGGAAIGARVSHLHEHTIWNLPLIGAALTLVSIFRKAQPSQSQM